MKKLRICLGVIFTFAFVFFMFLIVGNQKESNHIPVLMYHHLEEGVNNTGTIDPDRFQDHMKSIQEAGYETITDYDLLAHLEEGKALPEKPILITFDDGYKSNYT